MSANTINVAEFVANVRKLFTSSTSGFVAEQLPYLVAFVERVEKYEAITASGVAVAWSESVSAVIADHRKRNTHSNITDDARRVTLLDLVEMTCDAAFAKRVRECCPAYERQTFNIPAGSWFSSR